MERRDFLKKSVFAGLTTGALFSIGGLNKLSAKGNNFREFDENEENASPYDLVAVKGGEPADMFDKAILSLGGMSAFIKKGQKVVVKPNIGWDVVPELAANTNPLLVKRIVEHCFKAGAKEVLVFDHTCDDWTKAYKSSGIEKAVKDAGGKMVPGNTEGYYHEKEITNGKKLKKDKVHEAILNADVFINVPVLKNHESAKLTISMKNLMGINWDRGFWHKNDLHQCIADFASQIKPHLNIVDAYNVMKKNGPRGVSADDVVMMKSLIVSRDMVAADAAAAKLFGLNPEDVKYIKIAHDMKVGRMDIDKLNINRIKM